ncbi:SDR family NAD(P)-dependent oxidoreductase, partial [Mycobacterium tuberculosis]
MSRAVIVTGAAGGIGAALCERMRKDGYTTIGIDKDVAPAAD